MLDTTVLMTTFNRDCLLQLGLESLRRWNPNIEIFVMNDGEPGNVEAICRLFHARHIFTGMRNKEKIHWRVPGFALNIGIQKSDKSIVVLTCAEMWHVNDCLTPMVEAVRNNNKILAIPYGKDDMDNRYLPNLDNEDIYKECVALKTELPFLMAIHREELLIIGGYDESFLGQSYDDDDLVERLLANGCSYQKVDTHCVHLYHPRYCHNKRATGRLALNKKLYLERKGQIVRNINRRWGVL